VLGGGAGGGGGASGSGDGGRGTGLFGRATAGGTAGAYSPLDDPRGGGSRGAG